MRILDSIKNTCVFLGKETSAGHIHWGGTGFFVEIPLQSNPDVCTRYLVTASHVADKLEPGKFFLRINKVGGGIAELVHPAEGVMQADKQRWYRHPSRYTDVAVYPCSPNPSRLEYNSIPIGQLLSTESALDRQMNGT